MFYITMLLVYTYCMQGRIQDFKLEGAHLKKIAPNGGRREKFWGISCEKLITMLRLFTLMIKSIQFSHNYLPLKIYFYISCPQSKLCTVYSSI
jgi:hypothetical protein